MNTSLMIESIVIRPSLIVIRSYELFIDAAGLGIQLRHFSAGPSFNSPSVPFVHYSLTVYLLATQSSLSLVLFSVTPSTYPGHAVSLTRLTLSDHQQLLVSPNHQPAQLAMTISSVQTLLPGRAEINATEKRAVKPPPQVYGVADFPFKGYNPPQPEGYEQSRSHPDTSAIVIDNGTFRLIVPSQRTILTPFPLIQAPVP